MVDKLVNTLQVHELESVLIAGQLVKRFQLQSSALIVEVMEYGATVLSVNLRTRDGELTNLTRGLARAEDYAHNTAYMGAVCGRYAGRIANARFDLPESEACVAQRVHLTANHGKHQLHGGNQGFDARLWTAESFSAADRIGVEFRYLSADGEEGFPGALDSYVRYSIDAAARLWMEYSATALDQTTPVNLTNHCYWNLGDGVQVLEHELQTTAASVLEFDDELLPTGVSLPTSGSALDFSRFRSFADAHAALSVNESADVTGLDHALHDFGEARESATGLEHLPRIARVREPQSGRVMQVYSDQPLMILYAGNALDGSVNHGGHSAHSGFCIECQQFPDAPNQPRFPSPFIKRGEVYEQTTVYAFAAPNLP